MIIKCTQEYSGLVLLLVVGSSLCVLLLVCKARYGTHSAGVQSNVWYVQCWCKARYATYSAAGAAGDWLKSVRGGANPDTAAGGMALGSGGADVALDDGILGWQLLLLLHLLHGRIGSVMRPQGQHKFSIGSE